MITMEILGKIRRMYLRDKLSLHEIAKRTGLSRNTIRSWLRKPEDETAPPAYVREKSPGKLSPYHATLELALKAETLRIKQNRRTSKALLRQTQAEGYTGNYEPRHQFHARTARTSPSHLDDHVEAAVNHPLAVERQSFRVHHAGQARVLHDLGADLVARGARGIGDP